MSARSSTNSGSQVPPPPQDRRMSYARLQQENIDDLRFFEEESSEDEDEEDEESDDESVYSKIIDMVLDEGEELGDSRDETFEMFTNFNEDEFLELYDVVREACACKTRGRKSSIEPMDQFFITLNFLKKYYGSYDLSRNFHLKEPTIRGIPRKVLRKILPTLKEKFQKKKTMIELRNAGIGFENYPNSIAVYDCTVQERYRPTGRIQSLYFPFLGKG